MRSSLLMLHIYGSGNREKGPLMDPTTCQQVALRIDRAGVSWDTGCSGLKLRGTLLHACPMPAACLSVPALTSDIAEILAVPSSALLCGVTK